MAVVETHVDASSRRCFEVLSDPRSYAYWVVGSREIRAADPDWPAPGSKFHHTVAGGLEDHTVVEEVEPNRRLRLRAKARPFGTAFVTVTMNDQNGGSLLRLEEEPADRMTKLLFNPVLDRVLHVRNIGSIERLKQLAEGEVPMPAGPLNRSPQEGPSDPVSAGGRVADPVAGFGRGFLAGLGGGVAMSISTFAEMRLTGRGPSKVPAETMKRVFGIRKLGETAERRMTAAAHFAVSGLIGAAWGTIAAAGLPRQLRAPVLYALAAAPDAAAVPAIGLAPPPWRWTPADVARTAGHHAVYTAVTQAIYSRLKR
ncbi:MAG TPA: SRPBCC family protein [Solirubrobacterales bacterium]|nr:SRPBCC family protein [Solirubrobacterales bacterium]